MSDQKTNLLLVKEVEKRHILYNFHLSGYLKNQETEKAWVEVGDVIKLTEKMKGSMFKAEPKHRQHLADDYRDPELPPLPLVVPYEFQRNECPSIESSMANVLSDPWLIDHLDQVRFSDKKRVVQDIEFIKSKRESILLRANAIREKKNRRLQQRDIDQAMKSLDTEGFKLTHGIMLMFLDRDVAMLQALKDVESSSFTSRGTLRTHRDGRFVMTSLKQWEQALKERDKGKAASTLLYLSLYFQNKYDPSYYWLIYELYHLAVKSCSGCKGNITEAVIQYLFGKFLLEKAKHFKEAEFHLERACNLSYGYNWTTDFVTRESNDHIHNNSNYLLHILLIKRAADCSYKKPLEAIKLVKKAVRVISRANNEGALADANYDLAVMYNRAHMPDRAVLTLEKALELYKIINDNKNICLALLLKAHCLRRMQDYKEAFETLKTVVKKAQETHLPSLEAKGYKHIAEYFIGKNKYQSANVFLKKSYNLFEQCDLRDELDEVSTLFSYVKAWLRIHDVYYILVKIMAKAKENMFDYPTFIEYGVPYYNRLFRLKFVYKMKDIYKPETNYHEEDAHDPPPKSQTSQNEDVETQKSTEDSPDRPQTSPEPGGRHECYVYPENAVEQGVHNVPEYFAFSDLTGLIFDKELDQATTLFDRVNIDRDSEIAVKILRKVPMQHRESKKSITRLLTMEIAAAQKLNCIRHSLYELSILVDRIQVDRKMRLLCQQLPETLEDDYEKQNEDELWKFTVEIVPYETLKPYNIWTKKANKSSQNLNYNYDSKPKVYSKLLNELYSLICHYQSYDERLAGEERHLEVRKDTEESGDRQLTTVRSTPMDNIPDHPRQPLKDLEAETAKQTKICRCKEPLRESRE